MRFILDPTSSYPSENPTVRQSTLRVRPPCDECHHQLTSRADYARMRDAPFYTLLPSLHTQYAKPVKPSKAPA